MAVTAVFKNDKIILPGPVGISQITRARWDAGIENMVERPAGHTHPMFTANMSQRPKLEFSTSDIGAVLGVIGVAGAGLGATTGYFKAGTQTGNVARATTSHDRLVINSSLGYWTQIKLPHNGRGEIDVCLQAQYDGTNNPFVWTAGVALNGNITATTFFGAGPCSINGSLVPQIKEITVDSGIKLIQEGEGSELWDTFVAVEETNPVITVRCLAKFNWASLGLTGLALDGTNGITFYARKYSTTGRVANGTAEHIKFVGANGTARPIDSTGEGSQLVTDSFRVDLIAGSDSVAPLVGTVGSAIS